MKHSNIQQLVARYLAGVASPEEIRFLLRQFKKKETETELRAVIRRQLEAGFEERKPGNQAMDKALQDTYETIKKQIDRKNEKENDLETLSHSRNIWLKISVAAAIALLIASSIFIFTTSNDKKGIRQQVVSVQKNDIAPGGNHAILTLANGTRVILDSVQNGIVSMQGATKILKLKNGQLAYNKQLAVGSKQLGNNQEDKVLYNTITTPRGGQYEVILSDGTKAWLNAASSIYFPSEFRGKTREVRITGEVYFEVKENVSHPFMVYFSSPQSDDKDREEVVQVLGTHFNIMTYKDEPVAKITLLQGAVKVKEENKEILLKPGQQLRVNPEGRITKVENVDSNGIVAWKNNQFWFDDDNIQTVMRELSRWYNVDVVIRGNIPQHFGGYISRNISISKVLEALQATSHLQFKIQNNTIIVSP